MWEEEEKEKENEREKERRRRERRRICIRAIVVEDCTLCHCVCFYYHKKLFSQIIIKQIKEFGELCKL
jgi:hypothetical protein